ncbi:MAG: NFACT RNA binding domain-containing protein, partial [Thermodesulfobacteriota bacterium]
READQSQKRAVKKLQRQLGHLQEDERRLQEMSVLGDTARFLQINLHRLDPKAKVDSVEGVDVDGTWRRVTLDPALNVQENMQRLFAKSRKGRRGLPYVQQRKQMLDQEYHDRLQRAGEAAAPAPEGFEHGPSEAVGRSGPRLPARFQGLAVHVFRSSEGFLLLRGKNKKANHALLTKAARPFDFWLHAQGGPGAHVILLRDHYGQEVPQTSLEQAACLAGLASHASSADKAEVMVALVRDVRPIKGAPLGQVRVETIQQTLVVALNAALEDRLRLSTEAAASSG